MKKNVGIVTSWFASGAGYVSKAYEFALSRQHNVFIYARGLYATGLKERRGDAEWDRPNVTWGKKHIEATGVWKRQFMRWIRNNKIDVIIFNEQRYWPAIVWARDAGVVCGAYVDYYTQQTVSWFAAYDFLICNTKRHCSVFKWHPHCFYVPWGVMPEYLNREVYKRGLKDGISFIISAGWSTNGVSDRRGGLIAVRAMKYVRGYCKLKLYSQYPVEKMSSEWKAALEADSRIEVITGTYSPFPYEEGDVYIYPSRLDGIGLTLPEALASGLPAITTDCAPMNEFVRDGYNGWTVQVDKYLGRQDGYYWAESIVEVKALAGVMQRVIDNSGEIAQYSQNARNYAKEKLNWMKNSECINDIVKQVDKSALIDDNLRNLISRQYYSPIIKLVRCIREIIRYITLAAKI